MAWRGRIAVVLLAGCGLVMADDGGREPSPRHPRQASEPPDASDRYARTPEDLVPYRRTRSPYRYLYLSPPLYRGPEREELLPAELESVRIGLMAPLEESAGVSMKRGIELAFSKANASGGYEGLPFELVVRNDQGLWGSSANTLVELAYVEKVWALIGSVDSTSTHVALRAALKAEIPIVNVGSSDPTITETGIPWMVRLTPDDRQTGYRLASLLFRERGYSRVAVFRSTDRYGRLGIQEFRDAARRLGRALPLEIQFDPSQEDFTPELDRFDDTRAEAVVLWCRAAPAARIVRQLRARGMSQSVFGTDLIVSATFLEAAGPAAEGVIGTYWMDLEREEDPSWRTFRRTYRGRFGVEPDAFASFGYDAADLIVESVRARGLNRARIRGALTGIRNFRGVSGAVSLDATSNNVSPLYLARVEGGRFVFQ